MAKPLRWYLTELKRRKVYGVAAAYAVVAFIVWQVADIAFPALGLPEAAVSLVLALTILGFPIALVLAWAYEVQPEAPAPPAGGGGSGDADPSPGAGPAPRPAARAAGEGAAAAIEPAATSEPTGPSSPGSTLDDAAEPPSESIAVLPFENLSAAADSEFFADGVTEEVTHMLARLAALRVVARTSAFAFKGQAVDIREVARKLDVTHVLEGSVRRSGERLRITVQLVDARRGFHVWSERYDRDLDDVFAIQEEIALQIADQLSVRLLRPALAADPTETAGGREVAATAGRAVSGERAPTDDLNAYDAYLRGRHQRAYFDPSSLGRAIRCFREALELDPDFAAAHAALAEVYAAQSIGLGYASRETMPLARVAADRALELAPDLADAHAARALVALFYDRQYERGKAGLDRAIELNPSYADAYLWSEFYWTYIARDYEAAIAATTRAQELSPLDASVKTRLGNTHYVFGHHDVAVSYFRELMARETDYPIFHMGLGDALVRQGKIEEGARETDLALALLGGPEGAPAAPMGVAGSFRGLRGDAEGARELLSRLEAREREGYVTAFWQGIVLAGMSDLDGAFARFERAFEQRDCSLLYICAAPRRLGIRDDPRLDGMLERLSLPPLGDAYDGPNA